MLPGLSTFLSRRLSGLENATRASLNIVSKKWVKYLGELPHLCVSGTTHCFKQDSNSGLQREGNVLLLPIDPEPQLSLHFITLETRRTLSPVRANLAKLAQTARQCRCIRP